MNTTTTDTTDIKPTEGCYDPILIEQMIEDFANTGKLVWVMFYIGNSTSNGMVRGYAGFSDAMSYRVRSNDFSEIQFKTSDIRCIHNNTITLR